VRFDQPWEILMAELELNLPIWEQIPMSTLQTIWRCDIVATDEPVMLRAPSPATRVPTEPLLPTPLIAHGPHDLSVLHSDTPNPWGSLSHCHYHSHPPRDFSSLRSDTLNPWASLCRHHRYSQKAQQPMCHKHHSFTYPAKIHVPTPVKPNPPPLTCVFETITHPHGIGPTKPIIRVPA
jgi:hypothetical protein